MNVSLSDSVGRREAVSVRISEAETEFADRDFDSERDGVGGGVLVNVSVLDFVGDFVKLIGVMVTVDVAFSDSEVEIDQVLLLKLSVLVPVSSSVLVSVGRSDLEGVGILVLDLVRERENDIEFESVGVRDFDDVFVGVGGGVRVFVSVNEIESVFVFVEVGEGVGGRVNVAETVIVLEKVAEGVGGTVSVAVTVAVLVFVLVCDDDFDDDFVGETDRENVWVGVGGGVFEMEFVTVLLNVDDFEKDAVLEHSVTMSFTDEFLANVAGWK